MASMASGSSQDAVSGSRRLVIAGSSNYTSSLVSAISRISRSLLKLDQVYIAVGGWEHIISLMYFWLARIKSCDGPP